MLGRVELALAGECGYLVQAVGGGVVAISRKLDTPVIAILGSIIRSCPINRIYFDNTNSKRRSDEKTILLQART